MQRTKKLSGGSKGELFETLYFYPDDVSSPTSLGEPLSTEQYNSLVKLKKAYQHQLAQPVQQEFYNGSLKIGAMRYIFKDLNGRVKLQKVLHSVNNSPFLEKLSVLSFDDFGNPLEVRKQDGMITVYLWGYNCQFPIVKIENSTYAEVRTVLSQDTIDALNDPSQTEHAMETLIGSVDTALRQDTRLSKAEIATFTYKPLVGMTSMTDPRGITEYYQYEGFQQLKDVLDFEKNMLKNYRYHYRP